MIGVISGVKELDGTPPRKPCNMDECETWDKSKRLQKGKQPWDDTGMWDGMWDGNLKGKCAK